MNPDSVRYFSILPQAGPFGLLLDMIGEPESVGAVPISASYMVGLLMAAQQHWMDITRSINSVRPKEGVTA